MDRLQPSSTLFPYTTLFRSRTPRPAVAVLARDRAAEVEHEARDLVGDRAHLLEPARDLEVDHGRSEEHTSELQSRLHLVCRLLLEKKKAITISLEAHFYSPI